MLQHGTQFICFYCYHPCIAIIILLNRYHKLQHRITAIRIFLLLFFIFFYFFIYYTCSLKHVLPLNTFLFNRTNVTWVNLLFLFLCVVSLPLPTQYRLRIRGWTERNIILCHYHRIPKKNTKNKAPFYSTSIGTQPIFTLLVSKRQEGGQCPPAGGVRNHF